MELSQRHSNEWLGSVRETFVGALLIGQSFDVWDFPHYLAGGLGGYVLIRAIDRTKET